MENNNIEVVNVEDLNKHEFAAFLESIDVSKEFLDDFKIRKNVGITINEYTWSADTLLDLVRALKEALYYIDALEYTLNEEDEKVAELKGDINDLEDRIDELEDDLWDTERKLGDAEDEVEELNEEISELNDRIDELKNEVSNLEDEVNTLEDKLSETEYDWM